MPVFTNKFSEEIWAQKYRFGEEKSIEDTWRRVAKALADVETENQEYWAEQFYSILENFAFVPAGRIISNAGLNLKGTTLLNCYVDGFTGKDQDSIEGIYNALYRQAKTLKSEGGYGFCCNVMRPRGAHIFGIANQSPGVVKFLELWDKSSEIITAGSGLKNSKKEKGFIRKGAQMVTIGDWHPSVEEFITIKQQPNTLTKFNMSVLVSDKLMQAVLNNDDWILYFPDYENNTTLYKEEWDGNERKWLDLFDGCFDEAFKVYKIMKARDLWELIMKSTYNRNDPGVLFIDTINRMNNLRYIEYIDATNPCGEEPFPRHNACLLSSYNLTQFINYKNKSFDYDKLGKYIPIAVRMADNVTEIANAPLPEQTKEILSKRRIGMGVFGYSSALTLLGLKYGNKETLAKTEELMDFLVNESYKASSLLAKEKGCFPAFVKEKYLESNFVKSVLKEDTVALIKKYGIRNSHLNSCQPTGNTSVLANNISSGIEPIFAPEYYRSYIITILPDGLVAPENIDFAKKKCQNNDGWKWIKEGDENLLEKEFNGEVYKIDKNRGLLKRELVQDYALWLAQQKDLDISDSLVTAQDLSVDDHINTLAVFAKYVDSAISKTNNFPHDYPYEEFKECYFKAWKSGIKGYTTYREGTMAEVLSVVDKQKTERPKSLDCDVHLTKYKGQEYFIFVGLKNNLPYEVFAGINHFTVLKNHDKGQIVKKKKSHYNFESGDLIIANITEYLSDDQEAVTRLVSSCLRYGGDINFIVGQLEKTKGDLSSFSKVLARVLKKYIPDGTESEDKCPECGGELVRESGCKRCLNCYFSVCS